MLTGRKHNEIKDLGYPSTPHYPHPPQSARTGAYARVYDIPTNQTHKIFSNESNIDQTSKESLFCLRDPSWSLFSFLNNQLTMVEVPNTGLFHISHLDNICIYSISTSTSSSWRTFFGQTPEELRIVSGHYPDTGGNGTGERRRGHLQVLYKQVDVPDEGRMRALSEAER